MPALERLIAGFKIFKLEHYEHRPEMFASLVTDGQRPEVLVIACSDSRVDPAILLRARPGELFVVRNVANLVPPHNPDKQHHGTSSALEFGVRDLGVKHIVVLGHSRCGGIQALRNYQDEPTRQGDRQFIASWVAIAAPALARCDCAGGDMSALEQAAIGVSLANLRGFPWIAERMAAGTLKLHGWWFDLEGGALWAHDQATGGFNQLA